MAQKPKIKKKIIYPAIFITIVVLAIFSRTVLAEWSGTFYNPGDTLNPECLPTDTNCDVLPPLTSLLGAVLLDQTGGQTIGTTIARLAKLWATDINTTDLTVTNTITGSISGNASTVTNATLTKNLTIDTGNVTIHGDAGNTSALTIGAGAVSVSGMNTGDDTVNDLYSGLSTSKQDALNGTGFIKANGASLTYDNSTYVPTTRTINGLDLSTNRTIGITDLGGVSISSPNVGQMLRYNGSSWVNGEPLAVTHNEIAGLQGGSAGQEYHLTSAEYTIATQAATTSVNGYLTSTDWNTFNGKQATGLDWLLNGNTLGAKKTLGSIDNYDIGFITNNTERMTILADGNVGIGTTTPVALLDVGGKASASGPFSSGNLPIASFSADANTASGVQLMNVNTGTGADFRFAIVDTTGNYTAFALPSVNNSAPTIFGMNRNTGTFLFNNGGTSRNMGIGTLGANDLVLGTNGADRIHILSTGNVGIGTTTPNILNKLTVIGNSFIAGNETATNITADGTLTVSGGTSSLNGQVTIGNNTSTNAGITLNTNQNGLMSMTSSATNYQFFQINDTAGHFYQFGINGNGGDLNSYNYSTGGLEIFTSGNNKTWVFGDGSNAYHSSTLPLHIASAGVSYFSGSLGIGKTTPNAGLEILRTTEQLRLSYDATHYSSFTVNSAGDLTLVGGTTAKLTATTFVGALTGNASTVTNGIYTTSQVTALTAVTSAGDKGKYLYNDPTTGVLSWATVAGGGATVALDNLASVAMNAPLQWNNSAATSLDIAPTANTVVGRALTVSAGSTLTGGTANMAGGNLTLNSGLGKGTGASSIIFQTGRTLTTGSTLQTLTTAMTILGSGNVGIGTTNPTSLFNVHTGTDANFGVRTMSGGGTGTGIDILSYNDANNATDVMEFEASRYNFRTGNVGIGTTAPGDKLEISGSGAGIKFSGTGGHIIQTTDATALTLQASDPNHYLKLDNTTNTMTLREYGNINFDAGNTSGIDMTIQGSTGNVGIGTISPTSKLHLAAGTLAIAPLGFTSGPLLTTPLAGKVEFLTDAYYGTITTGPTRKTFAFLESPTFTGTVTTPAIQITTGANNGYVLKSDALGNGTWQSTSGMTYKGAWDATANTPTLADGTGTAGDMYAVSVGGTQFTRTFVAGGWAIYNGVSAIWEPVGTSASITAVNSLAGIVQLNPIIAGNILSITGGTATADLGSISTIGNAGTVTTNANLTGAITSVGNATILGTSSFSSANLLGALSDKTGTGLAVFGTSPTFTTSLISPEIDGSTSANGVLTLQGTTNDTRTTSYLNLQPNGGKVGIGTTTPQLGLDVFAGLKGLPATSGTTQTGIFRTRATNGTGVMDQGQISGGGSWLQSTDSGDLSLNYRLLLNPNGGNVGIGTTNPYYGLDIYNGHISFKNATSQTDQGGDVKNMGVGWASSAQVNVLSNLITVDRNGNYGGDFKFYSRSPGGGSMPAALMTILATGNVGIGTTTPNTKLEIGSSDLGNGVAGPVITLGRNTNATNTGAGSINFLSNAGTAGYVWQDTAGKMRISTAAPTNALDTSGTVVGDQSSTRETKQDITNYTNYNDALSMVLNAPLHTFRYIKEVNGYGTDSPLAKVRIGYISDEVNPLFMWDNTIDQVSVNGILMASIKELNLKITDLQNGGGEENVGSPTKRTGITLYDEVTGDPYCLSIANGAQKTTAGECIVTEATIPSQVPATPDPTPTPPSETSLTPQPEVPPTATPDPTPTPPSETSLTPQPEVPPTSTPDPTPTPTPAPASTTP